jgi:methyltransferase (TIGR00027 family)
MAMVGGGARSGAVSIGPAGSCADNARVANPVAFTARMCAAARWEETQRRDSIFEDPLAERLAGNEGMGSPMGSWIMTPRTRYGDDFLRSHYARGCRQLVLPGAGMDSRAFRMHGLPDLRVYEVDQQTIFDVKEPLVRGETVRVASRSVVATEFTQRGKWTDDLVSAGYDPRVPTVWLLEGLFMYLSPDDGAHLMREVGQLSCTGSAVFHDAISMHYITAGIVVGGAPFIGGSDEYGRLWAEYAGFDTGFVRNFRSVAVDRARRAVVVDPRVSEATPASLAGRDVVLFVEAQKTNTGSNPEE